MRNVLAPIARCTGILAGLALSLALLPLAAQAEKGNPPPRMTPEPAAPAAAASASAAKPHDGEESVTLNFVNADIEAVVRAIGQYTGRSFVIDPRVKGTLTLVTERPVTRRQAYEELLSALRLQGFTLVESPEAGGVARVLLEADAKLQGSRVVAPSGPGARGDQVVTQVFRLQYESASNLVPVLRPLIAPNNTIAAYAATNTLVITDYADNLRRLAHIIEAIDSPATAEIEVVPVKYGLAADIAAIVNHVLDEGARATGQGVDAGQRVLVQSETRSNSLILRTASRARLEQAKSLIEHFDAPSATPGNINVIYLRNAQATKLAPLLRAVLSSDPSFVAQAGNSTGLSPGNSSAGGGTGLSGAAGANGGGSSFGSGPGASSAFGGGGGGGAATGATPASSGGGNSNDRSGLAGMIQADPATNALIISAPETVYRNIRAIVDKLDVRPAQVLIESLVAEISADNAQEFGIQWQALNGLNNAGTSGIAGTNFGGSTQNIINASSSLAGLGQGLNIGVIQGGQINIPGIGLVTNINVLARALETKVNANILSRPNIQTLDNEEGKFLVGQNVPFVTGSYSQTASTATVSPFQTFERHDVGLQLRVKPQISEGGSVRLAIYIEDSSVSSGSTGTNLILNKRSFETSVIVEDGNFVVISGMIQDQVNENQYKVPLLGDIPYLGNLFRYDTREHVKTQTMVFLRPTVIRDEAGSHVVLQDRYDYIRNEMTQAAPAPHPILRDMPLPIPPLPPAPGAPAAATVAPGSRVVAAVVDSAEEAGQLRRRLQEAGLAAHWEPVAAGGSASTQLRVIVDRDPRSADDVMAILRGMGLAPTLAAESAPPGATPAP